MADKPPAGKSGGGKSAPPPAGKTGSVLAEILVFLLILIFIIIPLLRLFTTPSGTSDAIFSALATFYAFVKSVATVISMAAIAIAIFSFIRIHEIDAEEKRKLKLTLSWENERNQKNERWVRVEQYMTSLNPSDWKVAILEADNILDDIIERMGYPGMTIGERMKRISAADFPYLEEAWEAHKVRNALAHKGTDYQLSRSDAEHVINIYYRIFTALGYL
jgi:hypothetical protein